MGDQPDSVSGQYRVQKVPSSAVDLAMEPQRHCCRDSACVAVLRPPEGDVEDDAEVAPAAKSKKWMKSRFDSSLFVTTQKFMDIVKNAPGGILHLKKIVPILGVPKRRLYDITSVLHGIHMVEKISKNHIRWIGPDIDTLGPSPTQKKLHDEISELTAQERALDDLLKDCAQQLFALTDDKDNERLAYVTYQDVQSIRAFREQMTIAVKAPAETTLEIPSPKEDSIALRIRSTKGPIDVYLFQPKQERSSNNVSENAMTSSPKSKHPEHPDEKEAPPQESEELLEVSDC